MPPSGVLIISAVSPMPRDSGRRVSLGGLLDYLVDRLGPEQVHYVLVSGGDVAPPKLPCRVHRLAAPSALVKLGTVGYAALLRRRLSLQEALLSSVSLRRDIARLSREVNAAVEVYDTIRMGQHRATPTAGTRQLLLLDDLYSVRYERMLAMPRQVRIDPLGEFASNVPSLLRGVARRPSVYRALLQWERRLVARRERQQAAEFETALLVSAEEAGRLRRETGLGSIEVLTPHIRAPKATPRAPAAPPEFVFLGRLTVPHNDDAVQTFLREVLPGLVAAVPSARLRIIGRGASPQVRELAASAPEHVTVEGFVEDLDGVLRGATALVAPLRFGSGIKLKVLDALARGVPVVGTGVALEGIPVDRSGRDGVVVEDNLAGWPELLARLVNPSVNTVRSRSARSSYVRTYDPGVVYAQYDRIFRPPPSA